jgi:hypothetical protein
MSLDWEYKVCEKCGKKYHITKIHVCEPKAELPDAFKKMFGID